MKMLFDYHTDESFIRAPFYNNHKYSDQRMNAMLKRELKLEKYIYSNTYLHEVFRKLYLSSLVLVSGMLLVALTIVFASKI